MFRFPFQHLAAVCLALLCGFSAAWGRDIPFFGDFAGKPAQTESPIHPDLEAGENALKSGNYETAADYFREYRLKANLAGDTATAEVAMGRELHACISANLADRAQKLLDEYRKLYPKKTYDGKLYQAQIFLLQRRYADAKQIMTSLRRDTSSPVTLQNLLCEAAIAEHDKDVAKAIEIYDEIIRQTGRKTTIGGRADERKLMLLADEGKLGDARKELELLLQARAEMQPVSVRDLDMNQIFLFFCDLQEAASAELPSGLSDNWTARIRKSPHPDEFFFIMASRIARIFAQRKDIVRTAEAYYLAQQCAPVREDAVQAVMNLLAVYNTLPDKKQAAVYAEDMLKLFTLSDLTREQGIQVAKILFDGNKKEKGIELCRQILTSSQEPETEQIYRLALRMALDTKSYAEAKQLIAIAGTLMPAQTIPLAFDEARVLELEWSYSDAVKKYDAILNMPGLPEKDRLNALRYAMRASAEMDKNEEIVRFGLLLLKADDKDVSALACVADAEFQMNLCRDAYTHFSKFAELAPHATAQEQETVSLALYRAAQCALKAGNTAGMVSTLEKLTDQYPKSEQYVRGLSLLIRAYFRIDEQEKAKTAANSLFQAYPDNSDAINTMLFSARQFFSLQEYDDAESFLTKLREVKESPAVRQEAYYLSARIAMEKNDTATAELHLSEMTKILPQEARLNLMGTLLRGEIHRKNKSFEKARKEYSDLLKDASGTLAAQIARQALGDTYFEEASLQTSAPAAGNAADLEQLETKKTALYGNALSEYKNALAMSDLTPEMKASVCYKVAKTANLTGKKDETTKALLELYALCDASQADLHPEISFWIIRGILLAEEIADSAASDYDIAHAAEQGLQWLGNSGKISEPSLEARIGKLKKLPQYQKPQPMKEQ